MPIDVELVLTSSPWALRQSFSAPMAVRRCDRNLTANLTANFVPPGERQRTSKVPLSVARPGGWPPASSID